MKITNDSIVKAKKIKRNLKKISNINEVRKVIDKAVSNKIESKGDHNKVVDKIVDVATTQVVEVPTSSSSKLQKRWNVKPLGDEGVWIPDNKLKQTSRCGSHVKFIDMVLGAGVVPKLGSKIGIIYEGYTASGKLFVSHLKRTKPYIFRFGLGEVVRGLEEGIKGMKVGGSREIEMSSEYGYGEEGGYDGLIQPNEMIIYQVTLVCLA